MSAFGNRAKELGQAGSSSGSGASSSGSSAAGRVVVRDNTGKYFILDLESNTRYALAGPGSGQYAAATQLYGEPLTSVSQLPQGYQDKQREFLKSAGLDPNSGSIFLDVGMGFTRGGAAVGGPGSGALFAPNEMEQVIAGLANDPFTGRLNPNPRDTVNAEGTPFVVPGTAGEQQDAFDIIKARLRDMGLASLAGKVEELLTTAPSDSEFWLWLRDQPEFQQEYSGIFDLQNQGEQLVPGGSLAQQVAGFLEYKNTVSTLLDQTGLSNVLLRNGKTVTNLVNEALANKVSKDEFEFRIGTVFRSITDAPPEVRAFFDEMFAGTNLSGDAALAAFMLDPTMTEDDLLQASETAVVGGAASAFGFDLTAGQAETLQRQTGISRFGQAAQGFQQASQLKPLTRETITETDDLTDFDAVQAAFGTNGTADEQFRRRLEGRAAKFAGGGGAAASNRGVFGLGSANR